MRNKRHLHPHQGVVLSFRVFGVWVCWLKQVACSPQEMDCSVQTSLYTHRPSVFTVYKFLSQLQTKSLSLFFISHEFDPQNNSALPFSQIFSAQLSPKKPVDLWAIASLVLQYYC